MSPIRMPSRCTAVLTFTCIAVFYVATTRGALGAPTGTNSVWIDVQDAYIPELDEAVWIISDDSVQIPLALSTPAGVGGLNVATVSSLSPGLGSAHFSSGGTSASVSEAFVSQPFVEIVPGWGARGGYFAINFASPPPGVDIVDPSVLMIAQVQESGGAPRGEFCALCLAVAVVCRAVYGINPQDPLFCVREACFPSPSPRPSSHARFDTGISPSESTSDGGADARTQPRGELDFTWLQTLRRYRNEILSASGEGQFYINFYESHSLEMFRATMASPGLAARLYKVGTEWAPAFQALVDGQGASVVVTQSMEDHLLSLFGTYESVGSPAFAQAIAFERTRLQLDQIAGLTMTQYQTQIETLGGTSAVEPASWGRVKALYR